MKVYPVNPNSLIVDPVTTAQKFALNILSGYYPQALEIKTSSEARAFISEHFQEYQELCMWRELEGDLHFGVND